MPGVKDPVHQWISFDDLEARIIATPIFQRLRRIRQMTCGEYVCPSANHTRMSHSLGVMHVAGLYGKSLQIKYPEVTDKYVKILRIAGLLHDIGHGPFSHAFDEAVYSDKYGDCKGHDKHRLYIVQNNNELNDLIVNYLPAILDIWENRDKIGGALLHGPIGADRIDFICRDSKMVNIGDYDWSRIINFVELSGPFNNSDTRVVYPVKLTGEIDHIFAIYRTLYDRFYFHKTTMAYWELIVTILSKMKAPLNMLHKIMDLDEFILLSEDEIIIQAHRRGIPEAGQLLNRTAPKLMEVNTDPCDVKTKPFQTLSKSRIQKYGIQVRYPNNEYRCMYEHLKENSIIRDMEYSKKFNYI